MSNKITYKTQEVFVPVGLPDLTFIVRTELERAIKAWEINKHKHLLIFGASKTGKTSLWKRYVLQDKVIKIACNSKTEINSVYREILKNLGAYFRTTEVIEKEKRNSLLGELQSLIPWIGVKGKIQGQREDIARSRFEKDFIQTDISSAIVIKFLKETNKIVVIEDFHYTSNNFRQMLSEDLKAFSDEQCPWIIVGVQHKTSNLLTFNIDLNQRIAEIPVESFTNEQLLEIIELGELALNIKFLPKIKEEIIKEVSGSASLLQNICQRICVIKDIFHTCEEECIISDTDIVSQACKEIAQENKTFYEKAFVEIARGGRSDGSTEKYRWFLKVIAQYDIPHNGLKNTEVFHYIRELGHKNIEQGSVTSGLSYLPKLLKENNLPALLDYDESKKRLFLLDNYMKFVMKWIPSLVEDLFDN